MDDGLMALRLGSQPTAGPAIPRAHPRRQRRALQEATEELQRALVLQPKYDDARRDSGCLVLREAGANR